MERDKRPKLGEIESFVKTPPEVILVFDNYRGPKLEEVADKTMSVRAAIAALVYHSTPYLNRIRPVICSFAGEHEEGGVAGSQRVANHLTDFGIPSENIVTRKNTITTTTDLMQLHSFMVANGLETVAIVTTDDHVQRTKAEIENHFGKGRRHGKKANFYVLSPSSEITRNLGSYFNGYNPTMYFRIQKAISLGRTRDLSGGLTEKIATAIARIPIRSLRMSIQRKAEDKSHPHTPVDLKRIQNASQRLLGK